MAKLDNPAGRLHALLSDFRDQADERRPVLDQWAKVLATETQGETLLALAEVTSLIPAIERELRVAGDEDQLVAFEEFSSSWLNWVTFPEIVGTAQVTGARSNLVSRTALAALGSISSFLSMTSSEGVLPSADAVEGLREQAQSLLDAVVNDDLLHPDVRRILLDYIHRLLWALDHLRIGGPGAVLSAAEHLSSQLRQAQKTTQSSVWDRVGDLVRTGWALFRVGPQAAAALDGWQGVAGEVIKALPAGD